MHIYYCHSCNKLIAPALIESGEVEIDENLPPRCPGCTIPSPRTASRSGRGKAVAASARAGRSTPAGTPTRRARSAAVLTRGTPSRGVRMSPPSSKKLEPVAEEPNAVEMPRARPPRAIEPPRARAPSARTTTPGKTPVAAIGAGLAGVFLIFLIIAMASRSDRKPVVKNKHAPVTVPDKPEKPQDGLTNKDFRGPGYIRPAPKKEEEKPTSVKGRYVRIELKGKKRTLSLAEVEIMSGDENVGPKGTATQSSLSSGGQASRAIDGRKDGNWKNNSVTHTKEEQNPWWEVDLGKDYDIRKVVVHNRTDGNLQGRLKEFTLKILDKDRNEVWKKEKVPTPKPYYMLFPK